jgi:1,4-alpha-glucan branching enzyme
MVCRCGLAHWGIFLLCLVVVSVCGLPCPARLLAYTPSDPMGATPHANSTVFRVWAPYAQSVGVRVNGGPPVPMVLEGGHTAPPDRIWTARIANARVGDRYQYVIDNGASTGAFVDPYAPELTGYDNSASSVIVDHAPVADHFEMPPANKLVIYEMHIGTFNADSSGKYTFSGAVGKLDYLQSLGVNAVEIMPIDLNPLSRSHNPQDYNWGYDGIDPFAINPSYGTPADFKGFVRACHSHGIAVIVDLVYNHLRGGNLLQRYGGFSSADYPDGAYFYGSNLGWSPWGPRPDFDRPQVRAYIEDNALMWLTEYGVDGERWDSVDNIRSYVPSGARDQERLAGGEQLLREFNEARPAHKLSIAEDLSSYPQTTQDTRDGGLGFDSRWNGALEGALRQAVSASDDSDRNLTRVVNALDVQFGDSAFRKVVYTEDHDTVGHPPRQIRFAVASDPNDPGSVKAKQLSTLASAIVLTAPGIPMLFQGQEMLDPRPFDFGQATYMDWSLAQSHAGIVKMYHDLIALRLNRAGKTAGLTENRLDIFHMDDQIKTLAYLRYGDSKSGDDVVVVANFSGQALPALKVGFPHAGLWRVRLDTGSRKYDPGFPSIVEHAPIAHPGALDGMDYSGEVSIGPYSALILSQ